MSVIGYRPQVKKQYMFFPEKDRNVMRTDKPGLSGMGAIVFRSEEDLLLKVPDKERFYAEVISPYKSALECWYIQHKSLGLYFRMIWLTAVTVINPANDSWKKLKDLPPMPEALQKLM